MDAILLLSALAIIKLLGHSKLQSLEAKCYLANTSTVNADLMETNRSQISVMVQRSISPNDDLEKLAIEAQQLASEKEKLDWKFNNHWFDKRRKL